ncbi:MAG TPA: gluconokinase [Dehalococcoidia bacterium]|nr:gluconokinase [Dehalococcoidia bacterium]
MPEVEPRKTERPLILTLDAGTSWVRAAVHDALARPVKGWNARRRHPTVVTAEGGVEQDAEGSLALVTDVIDDVLAQSGLQAGDIAAVSMAVLASSLVGVDAADRPVTPLYLYSDTRPAAEVDTLRQRLDPRRVHQRTGCPIHTSYLPARLLWLALREPALNAASRRWLALPDFVYRRFFGRATSSFSIASWSGLLDHAALNWDYELLEILQADPKRLTPIAEEPLEGLSEPYATRWPVLKTVPWFPAYADGVASNIGSGCADEGTVAMSLSTTAALRAVTGASERELPPALWRYRVDSRRPLLGGATNEGGGVMRWLARTLNTAHGVDEAAASVAPDSHGLTVLPFLTGERSPGWQSQLRGTVAGLSPNTQPADIVRAFMESSAYRLAHVAAAMTDYGLTPERIRANGGAAARYPTWLQIIADVLGVTIEVSGEREATSRGAAVLALERLGHRDLPPAAVSEQLFLPDPDRTAIYDEAIRRQSSLYARLVDWFEPE